MLDDNDDVSSDEFLDHPGSLPRNSFGYDASDYDPIMRNSSLTLETCSRSPKQKLKGGKGSKGSKGINKGTVLNKEYDRTCASSCCEN